MSATAKVVIDPYYYLQKVADGLLVLEAAVEANHNYYSVKNSLLEHYKRTGSTGLAHAVAQAMRQGKIS